MSRVIFDPKRVGETKSYDFIFPLPVGVTISSATVTAAVYSGTDSNPAALVSGSASISGATVTQKIAAGTSGVLYDLLCAAVLSDGQTLNISGYLAVVPSTP